MVSKQPELFIFAGPNGSGKSSFLSGLIPNDVDFINPDEISLEIAISKGLAPDEAQNAVYQTGHSITALRMVRKIMLEKLKQGVSFAIETALNNIGYKNIIKEALKKEYRINLWFVGTECAEINIRRVRSRVCKGGHGVPKQDIIRRYNGALQRLREYADLADEVKIYDNSVDNTPKPRLILHLLSGNIIKRADDMPRWVSDSMFPPNSGYYSLLNKKE